MAIKAISKDYGATVSADTYVSGIRAHIWLPQMYEIMLQRTVAEIRKRLDKDPDNWVVLYDLGCGPGHFTLALAQRVATELKDKALKVSIIGIDNSPSFLVYAFDKSFDLSPEARRLVRFEEGNVLKLELQPVHIVTTSGFVHHFPIDEQGAVMDKIASLLLEGGMWIDGDEHPAPYAWFEKKFPGKGRALSLCTLYFQVIAAACKSNSTELMEAEIENFLAEVYRDLSEITLQVARGKLVLLVKEHARMFMETLVRDGLETACRTWALPFFVEIERAMETKPGNPQLCDRGDFKVPLPMYDDMARAHGFKLLTIYDTGDNFGLGSAPAVVFQKK